MCLIAYVPKGKYLSREVFDNANRINPHGIGVMSSQGVEKFFGNKQLKRARQYVDGLVKLGIAHAVHWRFATHGTKGMALCHPFRLPNAEVWMMHNGVIGQTSKEATDEASDTLLYVNKLIDAPEAYSEDLTYWTNVAKDIGRSNKGLVMYPDGKFIILNKDDGCEVDDIWYSNSYSLPLHIRATVHTDFVPARLRPPITHYRWPPTRDNYYETGMRAGDVGAPFGSVIYWSSQNQSYGFWEGTKFTKLIISQGEVIDIMAPAPVKAITRPAVDFDTGELTDERKCPRCLRFKKKEDAPHGFLPCWCRDQDVQDYLERQRKKAEAAAPSGPTLGESVPASKMPADQCEHGNTSWEDCRECIAEIEADGGNDVQRWLAHRAGYRIRSTNPDERAQELAEKVIYLPRASDK